MLDHLEKVGSVWGWLHRLKLLCSSVSYYCCSVAITWFISVDFNQPKLCLGELCLHFYMVFSVRNTTNGFASAFKCLSDSLPKSTPGLLPIKRLKAIKITHLATCTYIFSKLYSVFSFSILEHCFFTGSSTGFCQCQGNIWAVASVIPFCV